MKDINISELLMDEPQGTKLYSPIFGECTFDHVVECIEQIWVRKNDSFYVFDRYGKYYSNGECLLFPSSTMRDWSKLSWERGDVLSNETGHICIFDKWVTEDYSHFNGKYSNDQEGYFAAPHRSTNEYHKMSDEEAIKYIRQIELEYNSTLNRKTLQLVHNKFRDGDIVVIEDNNYKALLIYKCKKGCFMHGYVTIVCIDGDNELSVDTIVNSLDKCVRHATEEEKQQLFDALANLGKRWNVETKTLEDLLKKQEFNPFDKVLVRDSKDERWRPAFFASFDEHCIHDYAYGLVGDPEGVFCKYCIPYEGNEHLLGKTDSPKEGGEK